MALRNYLYAKHDGDTYTLTLINKSPSNEETNPKTRTSRRRVTGEVHHHHHHHHHHHDDDTHSHTHSSKSHDEACGSGRELVMEDGSKKCANCADCPKKSASISSTDSNQSSNDMDMDDGVATPKVAVSITENSVDINSLNRKVDNLYLDEKHLLNEKSNLPHEIDFTNVL